MTVHRKTFPVPVISVACQQRYMAIALDNAIGADPLVVRFIAGDVSLYLIVLFKSWEQTQEDGRVNQIWGEYDSAIVLKFCVQHLA